MDQPSPDVPNLLERVTAASQLDDGSYERRAEVVGLLLTAVDALESAVQEAPTEDPARRARLDHLRSTVDWLQKMMSVYSRVEWPVHAERAARDAGSLYEILEQRPRS